MRGRVGMALERVAHRLPFTLGLILGATLLSGCIAAEQGVSPPAGSPTEFQGTPAEWTVLYRACFEEAGLETSDDPHGDKSGFLVRAEGVTQEKRDEARISCQSEIGMPWMSGLSEDELRIRYDARVSQFKCLVDLGLVNSAPMS